MQNRALLFLLLSLAIGLRPSLVLATVRAKLPEYATLKKVKPVSLIVGEKSEAKLEVSVVNGFHVQANPASQPNLIPTTLTLDKVDSLSVENPVYPAGKPHSVQGTPGELLAYDGTFEIKISVLAESGIKLGKHMLKGKLRYQACNEKTCFFPVTIPVSIPLSIALPKKT